MVLVAGQKAVLLFLELLVSRFWACWCCCFFMVSKRNFLMNSTLTFRGPFSRIDSQIEDMPFLIGRLLVAGTVEAISIGLIVKGD